MDVTGKLVDIKDLGGKNLTTISLPEVDITKIKEGDEVWVKVRISQYMKECIKDYNLINWYAGKEGIVAHFPSPDFCKCEKPLQYPLCEKLKCNQCHRCLLPLPPQPKLEVPEKREGMKCIKEFTQDEVVGICEFSKHIIIATKHGVYCYPPDMKFDLRQEKDTNER